MPNNFDAAFVRRWAAMAVELLREHRTELNALNVFPVPDGDTGTNLFLSFQAAATAELERLGKADDLADAWAALARGALLGARGNSGVLLASVLQAIADAVASDSNLSVKDLLKLGAKAARAAVHRPVEGTALSVLDAAAQAEFAHPAAIAQAARLALSNTRAQLPALKAAGVVDAGGRGVVILLDALSAAWAGREVASPAVGFVPHSVPPAVTCADDAKFELMFVVPADQLPAALQVIGEQGSSLIVTEGNLQAQIHIHLDSPAELLQHLTNNLEITQIQIEPLQQAAVNRRVIAQVFGPSLAEILSDDHVRLIPAEPNQRLSVQDFVAAGLKANCPEVILLPSDYDTIKVAQLAAVELEQHGITAQVVATTTLPQTLAAIAVFEAATDSVQIAAQMLQAAAQTKSYGIAIAENAILISAQNVSRGDWVLTLEGQVIAAGSDFLTLLNEQDLSAAEVITVLVGEGLSEADLQRLREFFSRQIPAAEIVEIAAGQKVWPLLIGVE